MGYAKSVPLPKSDYHKDISKHKDIGEPTYKEYDGGNYYKFVYNQEPILFQNYCNVENLRYTRYPGLGKFTHNISETYDDYTHLRVLIKYDDCELECMFDKQNIDSGVFEFIIYNIKNKDELQLRKFVEDDYNNYNEKQLKELKRKPLLTGFRLSKLFGIQAPTPTAIQAPTSTAADLLEVNEINPILKASSGIYIKKYEDGTTNYIIKFRNVLSNEPKKEEKEKLINYLTDKYKFDCYTPFFKNATIEIVKEDKRNEHYIKTILFSRDDYYAWMKKYREDNSTTTECVEKKFNNNESEVCDDGDTMKTTVDKQYTGITTKTTYNKEGIIKKQEEIYPISEDDKSILIVTRKYDEQGREKNKRTIYTLPDGTIYYDTGELQTYYDTGELQTINRGGRKSKRRNSKRNRRSSNKKRSSRRK
jgi:hypothetical protein